MCVVASAAQLAGVYVLLCALLLGAAYGAVTLSDVPKTYNLYRSGSEKCADVLRITGTGPTLAQTSLIVDGAPCTAGSVELVAAKKGHHNWSVQRQQAAGGVLRGDVTGKLVCGGAQFGNMHIIRPQSSFAIAVLGTDNPVVYAPGWQYVTMWGNGVGCVYRAQNEAPKSAPPPPAASEKPKSATDATEQSNGSGDNGGASASTGNGTQKGDARPVDGVEQESRKSAGDTEMLWLWLGPVLGAIATILAAFITICTFKRKKKPVAIVLDDRLQSVQSVQTVHIVRNEGEVAAIIRQHSGSSLDRRDHSKEASAVLHS